MTRGSAPEELPHGLSFVHGDLTDPQAVLEACNGVSCVFHLASFGMSADEAVDRARVALVNVTGTQLLVHACCVQGVESLVYVSTYNVVRDSCHFSRP